MPLTFPQPLSISPSATHYPPKKENRLLLPYPQLKHPFILLIIFRNAFTEEKSSLVSPTIIYQERKVVHLYKGPALIGWTGLPFSMMVMVMMVMVMMVMGMMVMVSSSLVQRSRFNWLDQVAIFLQTVFYNQSIIIFHRDKLEPDDRLSEKSYLNYTKNNCKSCPTIKGQYHKKRYRRSASKIGISSLQKSNNENHDIVRRPPVPC